MRARIITIVAAAVVLTWTIPSWATDSPAVLTDYRITSWSGGDGVTLGPVTAIVQDRDGYLWLASGAGLVRFDGFRFATTDIVFGATKLPAAPTRTVYLARDGSLWVGYGDGHGIYQIVNGEVNAVHLKGLFTGFVRAITEDRSGALWVGYDEGLYRFVNNKWDRVSMPLDGLDRRVFDIHEDRAGTLWVATAAGLYRRAADGTFEKGDDADATVFAISEDASGGLWITDDASGVRRVGVRHSKHLVDGRGYGLLNDSRGNMWVATTAQGLWQVRQGSDGSPDSVKQVTVQTGLLADEVSDFLEDRDGNIWVGAIRGISRLTPHKVQSLVDVGVVNALTADARGTVWAGTTTGVVALSSSDARPTGRRTTIAADSIRALHRDAAGTIWAATRDGLHRIVNGRLVPVPAEGAALNRITSISSDRTGALWICDEVEGVLRLAGAHLERVTALTDGISARPIFLYADGMDRIWVAFDGGIVRMRSNDDSKIQQYGPSDGLLHANINAIHYDRRGDLWIGGNRGLSRLHGTRFETLTDHNGLPPRAVTSVIDDDNGNLWLTYRYFGFVRVARDEIDRAIGDPAHRVRYESYSMSDGIAGAPDLLNGDIATKSADGRLWFVTGRGLTIFNPTEHRTEVDSEPSVPRIEGVTADDRRYRTAGGTALPPRTGRLRIDYTVVNLASLDKISFRYRLDGFDKDWVDGTMPRQAYYTNLPPGEYRFRLQAAHDTQTWTDAEADWSFRIAPMFYETRWFYAASIVAVGLIAVGVWRVRIRQVRKQLALVYNERIRLSRDIHDTLLQSLYGVALQLDAAPRDPTPSPLRMHLQRIRRQIDDHISEARQAIWDLRSPALNRQDLVGALRDSGEALTAGKVSFNLTVTGTPRRYPSKLETHVLRIGHEAVMNAVRHAGARHVELALGFSDQGLSLRVTDDGRGFDISQHSMLHLSHYGLVNMKERAADVGGRCIIESTPGAGSSVIAEFPLAPVA